MNLAKAITALMELDIDVTFTSFLGEPHSVELRMRQLPAHTARVSYNPDRISIEGALERAVTMLIPDAAKTGYPTKRLMEVIK